MNFFWDNLYDTYKDRRYAALFMISLGALALLPILLPVMGLYALARGWSALCVSRASRRIKLRHLPLSRDEKLKARSKLIRTKR